MTDFTDIGQATFVPSQENSNNFYTTVMSKIFSGDIDVIDIDPSTTPASSSLFTTYPSFTTFGSLGTTQISVDPLGRYLGGDGLTATFVSNVDSKEDLRMRGQRHVQPPHVRRLDRQQRVLDAVRLHA